VRPGFEYVSVCRPGLPVCRPAADSESSPSFRSPSAYQSSFTPERGSGYRQEGDSFGLEHEKRWLTVTGRDSKGMVCPPRSVSQLPRRTLQSRGPSVWWRLAEAVDSATSLRHLLGQSMTGQPCKWSTERKKHRAVTLSTIPRNLDTGASLADGAPSTDCSALLLRSARVSALAGVGVPPTSSRAKCALTAGGPAEPTRPEGVAVPRAHPKRRMGLRTCASRQNRAPIRPLVRHSEPSPRIEPRTRKPRICRDFAERRIRDSNPCRRRERAVS
jgi:hypothetical protein